MENKLLKVLHAYHPNEDIKFEKADILVYRDALILTGYEKLGDAMSSFVHYQFNDLKLPGIYNTQIQLAEDQIPNAYRTAVIKNVYHCEPTFVLVPQTELSGINSFEAYSAAYSEPAEKLLIDDIESVRSREFYNYPFRVYNDLFFAFENANFFSYHRPLYEILRNKSANGEMVFVSIKSKNVEVIIFKGGALLQSNTYSISSNTEIKDIIQKNLKQVSIDSSSSDIYITCVRKEEKDEIFANLKSDFANFNSKSEATFGFPISFWDIYGDLILCS